MNHPNGQHEAQQQAMFAQIQMQSAAMKEQLDELVAKNMEGFKALAMRGIQFDPMQLANARMDTIIDSVAEIMGPQGQLWVFATRLRFEKLIESHIEQANDQGRKAQLAQGGSFSPQMIRQLAKESGVFGGVKG